MLLAVPPYLDPTHIHVYIDGLETEAFTWVNAQVVSTIAATNRLVRVIRRTSQDARLTAYLNGQPLPGDVLEVDSRQAFYMAQEAIDLALLAGSGNGSGGTPPGFELTTDGIKQLLLGQITPSLLEISLREEIGLISAPGSVPGSPAFLAAQESLARTQALVAEAQARSDALLQEAQARGAAITHVNELLQTETTSRLQQVSQLTAAVNGSLAAIQQVDSVQSDQAAALAGTVTTLQTQFTNEKGVTEAKINEVRETVSTANSALSQRIDTVQAQLGSSENLFPGPAFDPANPKGWNASNLFRSTAAGVPAGAPGDYVLKVSADTFHDTAVACEPGTTLDCVIWAARPSQAGTFGLFLTFLDSAGSPINGNTAVMIPTFTVPYWARYAGRIVVPLGALHFRVVLQTGETTYYCAPTIEKRPEAFAAVEQAINTVATRTAGVESQWTIKVQARLDGKNAIAGIGLNATASNSGPTQSQMVFLADQFTFVPSQSDLNVVPQPLLVMGLVNGQNTLVVPPSRYGDQLIEARMIVDGGIEARHMKITGGYGQAMNMDPQFQDRSAWTSGGNCSFVTISDGAAGTYAVQMIDQSQVVSKPFQVSAGKQFKVSTWARKVNGAGRFWMRLHFRRSDGSVLYYETYDIVSGVPYESFTLGNGWNQLIGTRQAPPGAVSAFITIDSNFGNTGISQFQDFRCEEMLDWSLIVQGGIKADRIDTRGMTIKDAAGTILFGGGTLLPKELVNGLGAFAAVNQITSANVSTYLANAAIGAAQVGVLTAANLTVTALSNTINGNAGPGARVEILTNVIKVYDDTNLVRVKLGNLQA